MNIYLAEAKQTLGRAASRAEEARRQYNSAVKEWKAATARYERLKFVALEEQLKLERERQAALADGDAVLATLLSR